MAGALNFPCRSLGVVPQPDSARDLLDDVVRHANAVAGAVDGASVTRMLRSMPSSKRTVTYQAVACDIFPPIDLPATAPPTAPTVVAMVLPVPPPMLLPSQSPRTAPPMARAAHC